MGNAKVISKETDQHNQILDLLDQINNHSAADMVTVIFNDGRPDRSCKILDLGLEHIYLSEGSDTTGRKIALSDVARIKWTATSDQYLEME